MPHRNCTSALFELIKWENYFDPYVGVQPFIWSIFRNTKIKKE
ncbi:MAG: hypothetical protein JWM14_496 [Chitinophagaceae bacterium]|nr:hypothetical protein [Chitinophagaceae bacterium]